MPDSTFRLDLFSSALMDASCPTAEGRNRTENQVGSSRRAEEVSCLRRTLLCLARASIVRRHPPDALKESGPTYSLLVSLSTMPLRKPPAAFGAAVSTGAGLPMPFRFV